MPTNRRRKLRSSKNRIPSNLTKEFMDSLEARDFLAECTNDIYHDALNEEEGKLLGEFLKCNRDFEKWLKFRERKKVRK